MSTQDWKYASDALYEIRTLCQLGCMSENNMEREIFKKINNDVVSLRNYSDDRIKESQKEK